MSRHFNRNELGFTNTVKIKTQKGEHTESQTGKFTEHIHEIKVGLLLQPLYHERTVALGIVNTDVDSQKRPTVIDD
ncbi:hypothetical protein J6590_056820 [Homalodisca vitripennis]|nr:hypothetical protein J6590_056820 [Homalodisca vitripennis]